MKYILIVVQILLIAGCSTTMSEIYDPNDFINLNRVVTEKVPASVTPPKVKATFGYGNDPQVLKAYEMYTKQGVAKNIASKGFKTFAYDAYFHPIVSCAPLRLCVIQLEQGERINNIDLGDAAHWLVSTSFVGSSSDGSYQVSLKPKLYNIATDIVISTNHRIYNIGLVSKKGASTHIVNFYYPEETFHKAIANAQSHENSGSIGNFVSRQTNIKVDKINFNYSFSGNRPPWRPTRVFDDGNKTFIQMPSITERMNLPVLYIRRGKQLELINYRFNRPYYVVDGLFKNAILVSGKGSSQERVIIKNRHFI